MLRMSEVNANARLKNTKTAINADNLGLKLSVSIHVVFQVQNHIGIKNILSSKQII